jgi:hypothetical protein
MSQSQLEPERGTKTTTPPGTPRWVKVFGMVALVVVLLFVISLLAGVRHGPGMHTPSGDAGGYILSSILRDGYLPSGGLLGGRA